MNDETSQSLGPTAAQAPSPTPGTPLGLGPSSRWWRNAVAYQVYIRSFKDSDGDGIGDIEGLRHCLPELADLGVKIIWINPCYPSPQRDHGYDIADYRAINPEYGSLEGFELMLAEAHALGIRVIMDIVPNHASVEHAWFHEAIASEPGSPERARFIFTEGEDGGETPPNTWTSVFGRGAWHRVEDGRENPQWYLHLFDWSQPDFNWRNPLVREEFLEILRFWFERGVDGFRIDVAHGLVKPARIPRGEGVGAEGLWGRPEVHEIYEEWRALADSYEEKKYFIGEVWVDSAEKLARFTEPGRLHQSFAFELLVQPWFAYRLRRSIERAFAVAGAEEGPAWALSNHDVHRVVTRLGQEQVDRDPDPRDMLADARRRWPVDVELGVRRAKAEAGLLFALPGTVYVYQGEELGLPEVIDLPDEVRQDPIFMRTGGAEFGRDGCRVPIPWSASGSSMGFGPEGGAKPWLPQPDSFRACARDLEKADPNSMLSLYKRLSRLRPELLGGASRVEWIDAVPKEVVAFRAGSLVCATNTADEEREAPLIEGASFLLNTADLVDSSGCGAKGSVLPANSTSWWRLG